MSTMIVGFGWQQLWTQLGVELRALDPGAELADPVIDADGLPRFRARLSSAAPPAARRLLRDYEQRAIATCEMCGHAGRVYAGPVLTIRCPSCCD